MRQDDSQTNSLGQDVATESLAQRLPCAQVDLHAQRLLELGAQSEDLERPGARLELDEEVDVAVWSLVTARHRPEDRHRGRTCFPDGR